MLLTLLVNIPRGILLPESVLYSTWFNILASFVAINTVMYLVLSFTKVLPKIRFKNRNGRNRRSETRSIDPDAAA